MQSHTPDTLARSLFVIVVSGVVAFMLAAFALLVLAGGAG